MKLPVILACLLIPTMAAAQSVTVFVNGQPVQIDFSAVPHAQLHKFLEPEVVAETPFVAAVKAQRSGSWSNLQTWPEDVGVPGERARVHIPSGITVTVDGEIATSYEWIRVDGVLRFAPDVTTKLVVETLVVMTGKLEIGTPTVPILPDIVARLVFRSDGKPIDHSRDPLELTRGLISMTPIFVYGSPKREISSLAVLPSAGATSLQLDVDPTNWKVGDEILVAPTIYDQDEVVKITSISGRTIGISPALKFTRTNVPAQPKVGPPVVYKIHVGNFTRNVIIATDPSQAGNPKLQGHVMLMGGGHRIFNAAFNDLGRTLAVATRDGKLVSVPVTDPLLLPDGTRDPQLMPLCKATEENPRGRYSLHFHSPGPMTPISIVEGVAVRVKRNAGFKIGIQNHSGHVAVRRAVVHQIDGSGLFAEEGNERGEYRDSLVVHSLGSGVSKPVVPDAPCASKYYPEIFHRRRHDMGHRGAAIWLQGGQVDVIGNVFAGHLQAGVDHSAAGLDKRLNNTFHVVFPIPGLKEDWWLNATTYGDQLYDALGIVPINVPPLTITDNVIYAIGGPRGGDNAAFVLDNAGLRLQDFRPRPKNLFARNLAWNVQNCFKAGYSNWGRIEDLTCLAGDVHPGFAVYGDTLRREGVNTRQQSGHFWDFARVRVNGFSSNLSGKDWRLLPGPGATFTDVTVDGQPYVPIEETCRSYDPASGVTTGDGIDNDGDGLIDEDCLAKAKQQIDHVPPPPPPPSDTTPPVVSLDIRRVGTYDYFVATVLVTEESATVVVLTFDGRAIAQYGSPTVVSATTTKYLFVIKNVTPGTHAVVVTATDAAGNVGRAEGTASL
jgi:hypothetical protein